MKHWLESKIEPLLRASNTDNHRQTSLLIERIAMNELYDLWVKWVSDKDVKWEAKGGESFVSWLEEELKVK